MKYRKKEGKIITPAVTQPHLIINAVVRTVPDERKHMYSQYIIQLFQRRETFGFPCGYKDLMTIALNNLLQSLSSSLSLFVCCDNERTTHFKTILYVFIYLFFLKDNHD